MADIPSLASSGLDYQSAPKDKPEEDKLTKIMRGTLPKTSFSEQGIWHKSWSVLVYFGSRDRSVQSALLTT